MLIDSQENGAVPIVNGAREDRRRWRSVLAAMWCKMVGRRRLCGVLWLVRSAMGSFRCAHQCIIVDRGRCCQYFFTSYQAFILLVIALYESAVPFEAVLTMKFLIESSPTCDVPVTPHKSMQFRKRKIRDASA